MNFSCRSRRLLTLALVRAPSFCYPSPTEMPHCTTICNLRQYERDENLKLADVVNIFLSLVRTPTFLDAF